MNRENELVRLGYTLPLEGFSLAELDNIGRRAEAAGYTDAWSGEVDGADGFTPLTITALATESMRVGVGVVSAFTRGPATIAMTAASVAEVAPGRFCLGLGAGSDVIVEGWNSIPFQKPLSRVRDVTDIVSKALAGEKVTEEHPTVQVRGFRLSRVPAEPVPIFIAALRRNMLRLAGSAGDGVLLNWLAPEDVPRALAELDEGARQAGRERPEVACRVFVCPGEPHQVEYAARRFIAAYLNVPVYREYHRWLGRGELLQPMNDAWAARDRKLATQVIPDEVLDGLILSGSRDRIHDHIQRYRDNGVDTVILHWLPTAPDPGDHGQQIVESLFDLAPGVNAR